MEGYIGLYDPDATYRELLMRGLMERCPQGARFVEFTRLDAIKSFSVGKKLVLLVICELAVNEEIMRDFEDMLVLLTEEQCEEENVKPPNVFKYQSLSTLAGKIFEQLMLHTSRDLSVSLYRPSMRGSIWGVYSPLGRCLKTSFSIAAAQIMGEHKRTLLLCFEEHSALPEMLDIEDYTGKDMSDAVYMYMQGELMSGIASVIMSCHSFDIILPPKNPQDIRELGERDLEEFIGAFADIYGCVIVDFGEGLLHINRALSVCRRIFMPVRTDWLSQVKLNKYFEFTRNTQPSLLNQIEQIRPPYQHTGSVQGGGNFNRLVSGEFYDYVRQCL